MYRVTLACNGVPVESGNQAAIDIAELFKQRPWHQNVLCKWDGASLILQAENDYDDRGLALADEFSDLIAACVSGGFDGDIKILSVDKFSK